MTGTDAHPVLPVMHVDLIGRNAAHTRRTLTTLLIYRRPWLARLVWVVVGRAHRRTVDWVLTTGLRPEPTDLRPEPVEGPSAGSGGSKP